MQILCVCLGNICRSPTAEAVLRAFSEERLQIDSAGTAGWHSGKPPYQPAIDAAAKRGYDLTPLRARQFTREDFDHFDLILAMDESNRADIEALRPEGNETPVRLLLSYVPDIGVSAVPDPYYTRDFEATLDLIEIASRHVVDAFS